MRRLYRLQSSLFIFHHIRFIQSEKLRSYMFFNTSGKATLYKIVFYFTKLLYLQH